MQAKHGERKNFSLSYYPHAGHFKYANMNMVGPQNNRIKIADRISACANHRKRTPDGPECWSTLSCQTISLSSRAHIFILTARASANFLAACGIIIIELLLKAPRDKPMQIVVITEGIIQNTRKLALWGIDWRLLRECA